MTQTELSPTTKESQAQKILKVLKDKGRITNVEIIKMYILRGSERIRELKKDGYRIVTHHVKGGIWEYVYMGHEDDD
jgi:hypothetical protein